MKTRTMRLSNEQVETLTALASGLKIKGQRGARLQPLIQWLADIAANAPHETAAALKIAAGCAADKDWDELIDAIRPDYPTGEGEQKMNAVEITFADGSEDRIFTNNEQEAIKFLRPHTRRKSATVRINPGGALIEFFDSRNTAAKEAIEHLESVGF